MTKFTIFMNLGVFFMITVLMTSCLDIFQTSSTMVNAYKFVLSEDSKHYNGAGMLLFQDYQYKNSFVPSIAMNLNSKKKLSFMMGKLKIEDSTTMEAANRITVQRTCNLIDFGQKSKNWVSKHDLGTVTVPNFPYDRKFYNIKFYSRNLFHGMKNAHGDSNEDWVSSNVQKKMCKSGQRVVFVPLDKLLLHASKINVQLQSSSPDQVKNKVETIEGQSYHMTVPTVDLLSKLIPHLQEVLYHYRPYNRQFETWTMDQHKNQLVKSADSFSVKITNFNPLLLALAVSVIFLLV